MARITVKKIIKIANKSENLFRKRSIAMGSLVDQEPLAITKFNRRIATLAVREALNHLKIKDKAKRAQIHYTVQDLRNANYYEKEAINDKLISLFGGVKVYRRFAELFAKYGKDATKKIELNF